MTKKAYLNAQRLRDGKLLLYNRKGNTKGIWHMRVLKPNGGYHFQSTKTSAIGEAARIAEDTLDQMRDNVRNNVPEIDLNYHELYTKWFAAIGKHKNAGRKSDIQKHHRLYFRPYFGEMNGCLMASFQFSHQSQRCQIALRQ
ncbi:MAG TPA: hypothetical protein EYQ26_03880 [Rhodospirillales bacterium]|nr:hypothetical protein [Rhodospirillales bacterium]